jgi:preprotein translocase subunit SecY
MPGKKSPIRSLIQNIFSIPDLRKRVLYMLGLLAVYRAGTLIPMPGINHDLVSSLIGANSGIFFDFINTHPLGALRRFSIFSLGIMPYITAFIILQLAAVVVPFLKKLSKERELGRKKITQYTRYLTVVLALSQGFMIAIPLERAGSIALNPSKGFRLMLMITLTAGTVFIMWIGEQITKLGLGNGICLIIFADIVVGLPRAIGEIYQHLVSRDWSIFIVAILIIVIVAVVASVVFWECGRRKIPVQYSAGKATHLHPKVNSGGVIPVIFAASIMAIPMPLVLALRFEFLRNFSDALKQGMPLYNLLCAVAIIFFCFFYAGIIFNSMEVADNIGKYGGYVPSIRPGQGTGEYIDSILSRLTAASALYLVLVCLLPEFLITGFKVQPLPWIGLWLDDFLSSVNLLSWIPTGLGGWYYFSGASLLIVVGVAMDTIQQIESQSGPARTD